MAPMSWRVITPGLAVLYIVAWALGGLALKTAPSDLDIFFWPSAQTVVAGHPLLIYASRGHELYPNANGPLGLVPLVPVAALANVLGWAADLRTRAALTDTMVAAFALLLAYQSVTLIAVARGALEWRRVAAATILLAPTLWISGLDFGHIEQPVELCLVLLAVRWSLAERQIGSGVAIGAAVLARTTAAVLLIPFLLGLLARRRPAATLVTTVAFAVTVAAGLAPFVIADAPAVVHSLITYRGSLPIGGGSFWIVARDTSLAGIAQHGDVYCAAAVATVITAFALRCRPDLATPTAGLLGLLLIASCTFPLFAKTVFPYYLFEPYVLGVVWWLARPGTARNWRVLVPLLLTADTLLTNIVASGASGVWGDIEGITSSAILAFVVGLVTVDLLRTLPAADAPAPSDASPIPLAKLVVQP